MGRGGAKGAEDVQIVTQWISAIVAVVALITGVATGVAGTILGVINYRRISKLKTLDLRLELKKATVDAGQALAALDELINYSNQSRFAVSAALGTLNTGGIELWKKQVAADQTTLSKLRSVMGTTASDYKGFDEGALEARLVEVHGVLGSVKGLTERYRQEVARDDRDREHIRIAAMARFSK